MSAEFVLQRAEDQWDLIVAQGAPELFGHGGCGKTPSWVTSAISGVPGSTRFAPLVWIRISSRCRASSSSAPTVIRTVDDTPTEVALRLPEEWTTIGNVSALPDGKPTVRRIGDVSVLLYRVGDHVTAMIERCSHETGPLGEGEVVGSGMDACVVCPWHGSTFRLADGLVVRGPAGNDQPLLRTRVDDGVLQVAQP